MGRTLLNVPLRGTSLEYYRIKAWLGVITKSYDSKAK